MITTGAPFPPSLSRAYGALWDALGLGPAREFGETAQQLAGATLEQAASNARYGWITACALGEGTQRFMLTLLASMPGRGDEGAGSTALLRQWLDGLDAAMHDAMLSGAGLEATAASVRASSRRRAARQRLIDLGAQHAGLPTRGEVDEAFREIQELKRELRRLRERPPRQGKEVANG